MNGIEQGCEGEEGGKTINNILLDLIHVTPLLRYKYHTSDVTHDEIFLL